MEVWIFFKSMYPGTWNFVSSSNPCTWVHGILFFLRIHVPGYINLRKQNLGTFWKKGWHGAKKNTFIFVSFFLSDFLKKIKIKVAPWRFESKLFRTQCWKWGRVFGDFWCVLWQQIYYLTNKVAIKLMSNFWDSN